MLPNIYVGLRDNCGVSQTYFLSLYSKNGCCLDVPINIYRVGQVSGDTENGVWNKSELAAMMIYAGAGQLHQMPNIGKDINWIPVNICSGALVDLALKSSFDLCRSSDDHVYHLLNPHSLSYEEYLQALRQAGFTFESVPPREFLNRVLNSDDLSNPLIKLTSFLEESFRNYENHKVAKFSLDKTIEKCPLLRNCPQIDSELIERYASYWKIS